MRLRPERFAQSINSLRSLRPPMPMLFFEYTEKSGAATPARLLRPTRFHGFAEMELRNGLYMLRLTDHGGSDESFVDFAAVSQFRNVASRFCEALQKLRFQGSVGNFLCQLNRAGCVPQDLSGFDPGNIVKKPAAAGEHEHRMACHLKQFETQMDLKFFKGDLLGMAVHEIQNIWL